MSETREQLKNLESTAQQLRLTEPGSDNNSELRAHLQKKVHDLVRQHLDKPEFWKHIQQKLHSDHLNPGLSTFPDINIETNAKGQLLGIEVRSASAGNLWAIDIVGKQQEYKAKQHIFNKFQELDRQSRQEYAATNHLLQPSQEVSSVSGAVARFVSGGHSVYSDSHWAFKHGGQAAIMNYLFWTEGHQRNPLETHPLRSGHELDFYQKIVNYARDHDITNPSKKITPAMLMTWSLKSNQDQSGRVCIQDALLTVHNVLRALARVREANANNLPESDAIRAIIIDNKGDGRHGPAQSGLCGILGKKYKIDLQEGSLFDRSNPASPFRATSDTNYASAGASYHFWVGAFAASTCSDTTATEAVWSEAIVIKKNNRLSREERPWGDAGVATYTAMQKLGI